MAKRLVVAERGRLLEEGRVQRLAAEGGPGSRQRGREPALVPNPSGAAEGLDQFLVEVEDGAQREVQDHLLGQAPEDLAVKQNDYLAQSFLQWFVDEQLEEVVKMDRLLSVIQQSGERNLLMVEAYLIHIDKAG